MSDRHGVPSPSGLDSTGEEARCPGGRSAEVVTVSRKALALFSHRLRSLLTCVGAASDYMLENEMERSVQTEMLSIISDQASRIDGLLDDFLVVASEDGGSGAARSVVDLYTVARQVVRELAREAQCTGAWLVLDAAGMVQPVLGEGRHLRQVVIGVMRSVLVLARPGERVVAQLADVGGAPAVELAVYVRSQDDRLADRARALTFDDLSLEAARRICEDHGGRCQLMTDRPGAVCRLPAAPLPADSLACASAGPGTRPFTS